MTKAFDEARKPCSGHKQAQPVPDPDSLAMDDRGTRIYRGKQAHPGQRHIPDDGNYTGDPNKPEEAIRAAADTESPQDWLPASDAPTIIRNQ